MPTHRRILVAAAALALVLYGHPPLASDSLPFEAQTLDDDVNIGYTIAAVDIDGDGLLDIVLVSADRIAWYRNPDWQRFVMAEGFSNADHIGLAARDITGDGRVEVAVGAEWNPANIARPDPGQSGSIYFLQRPDDPTQRWEPVRVEPHEPLTHRLAWMQVREGDFRLVVKPLAARPDTTGTRNYAYRMPDDGDPRGEWSRELIEDRLNMSHGMTLMPQPATGRDVLLLGGAEGIRVAWTDDEGHWQGYRFSAEGMERGAGEIALGQLVDINGMQLPRNIATIEPMHGNSVVVYRVEAAPQAPDQPPVMRRTLLDDSLNLGHALLIGDFLGLGVDNEQVVAGWRDRDANGQVGIRMYVPVGEGDNRRWETHWLDEDGVATEFLAAADLNGNGHLDIIAGGRATGNLRVYWNRSGDD